MPREALGDLLLLSAVQAANLKYAGMLAADGIDEPAEHAAVSPGPDAWSSLGRPDRDEPFVCFRDGSCETVGVVARRGLPAL